MKHSLIKRLTILIVSGCVATCTGLPVHAQEQASTVQSKDLVWAVMAGATLKSSLEGWARSAGWTVVWDSDDDYRVKASASFYGPFEQVSERLVAAIHQHHPEISVTLYKGNNVVHVETDSITSN